MQKSVLYFYITLLCACGTKLDAEMACPACALRYRKVATGLEEA